jgi:hypothetical protein
VTHSWLSTEGAASDPHRGRQWGGDGSLKGGNSRLF